MDKEMKGRKELTNKLSISTGAGPGWGRALIRESNPKNSTSNLYMVIVVFRSVAVVVIIAVAVYKYIDS